MTIETETRLTIIQIAQLTAAIEGGGFKRSANKAVAIKKFVAAALGFGLLQKEVDGIFNTAEILGFEEVKTVLVATLKDATTNHEAPTVPDAPVEPTPSVVNPPKTKRESDLDKIITVVNNGRREGSYAHTTLVTVQASIVPVTVREFIAMGGLRINLRYDIKKGFVTVDAA